MNIRTRPINAILIAWLLFCGLLRIMLSINMPDYFIDYESNIQILNGVLDLVWLPEDDEMNFETSNAVCPIQPI